MKKIAQSLFLFAAVLLLGTSNLSAQSNLEEALNQAKENNKHVLINFSGSDWCRSCILLKKTILNTSEFKSFADKELVILDVDFPRLKKNRLSKEQTAKNEALAEKYNKKGQFPTIILLDKEGKVVGKTGYKKLSPAQYIAHIESIIK
ncbi:thioredoxin fold domain-containing protein [Marinifilum sp. N1E240]|uniref:thioredoxin family protein n=1 Tax=Marinifilum sp. N1E240 TaxID=2608082 RepID=UPI00128CF798|nr:thioredoxin family protein [Marinifilum sp. N1E240]MPQ46275.1 thioredoxin fold domain-containing protein [Marinifilum sp. N1E240]